MRSYRTWGMAWAVFSSAATLAVAAAAPGQLTSIAAGLQNPRGLAFGPNGSLYVAEAGTGAGNGQFGLGVGLTGSILEILGAGTAHPVVRTLVSGLASSATLEGGPSVVGPDGISVHGNGGIYVIMAESTTAILKDNPDVSTKTANQFGRLLKFTPSGRFNVVSDVGDFDYDWADANQAASWAPQGQFPDANPYGVLALPAVQYVVDAGANTLDEVRPDGSTRIIAYFPNPVLPPPAPNAPPVTISDAVPTCVAIGPDGYLYVGTLAFGANFARVGQNAPSSWATLPPQSKIYRVNPNSTEFFLTENDVWASGFNPITACGFGPGGLYVVEFETQDSQYTTGDVVQVALNPNGKAGARTALGVGALVRPNGFAVGADGSIYVSNNSTSSTDGQVVRVNF
jgi:hypothetical protein